MSRRRLYCTRCLTPFDPDPVACTNPKCARPRPVEGWASVLGEGDVLDRHYQIERVLAVGGAGITYKARELDSDGRVRPPDLAIKLLYDEKSSGTYLRRLATEAQILRELKHDHIVNCRGFVHRSGSTPYLVTLYEQGGSLSEHLQRVGPLPVPVVAAVLRQVLSALAETHARGVVHRDLKPDNVLLRQRVERHEVPHVCVADFGIAKLAGPGLGQATQQGIFMGTPEFAAPEQFLGLRPTPATDIFAAGALAYFLLTGMHAVRFSDRTNPDTCVGELDAQLPPRLPPDLDGLPEQRECLQRLIASAMHASPDERPSVRMMLDELHVIGAAGGIEPDPGGSQPAVVPEDRPQGASQLLGADRTVWVRNPVGSSRPARVSSVSEPTVASARTVERVTGPSPSVVTAPMLEPTPQRPTPTPSLPDLPPRRSSFSGFLGALAGVLGLGMASAGVTAIVGTGLSVLVLVGSAWALGWFESGEAEVILDEVVIERTK